MNKSQTFIQITKEQKLVKLNIKIYICVLLKNEMNFHFSHG